MYIFETGLGQIFKLRKEPPKPRSKTLAKWPFKEGWVVKDGHRRSCVEFSGGFGGCGLELKVRFRRSFEDFLREVENAYGRWVARSTAQRLMNELRQKLKELHQEMINGKLLDNDPIILKGNINYRRSKGTWFVENGNLSQWFGLIDL
jgi:hypothetical protein